MIGVDSLHVLAGEWDVAPDHQLMVRSADFSPVTGEEKGSYLLWREDGVAQFGRRAYYNDPQGRFFVDVHPVGGQVRCGVHLSLPRFASGGVDNVKLLSRTEAVDVLENLGRELSAVGVKTDLDTAQLSRVDVTRNVETDEPFTVYRPVLSLVEGKRMRDKREYVDGFLWGNSARQVVAYDKRAQLVAEKLRLTDVPDHLLRFEMRLRDHRTAVSTLGYANVGDLKREYDGVSDVYRRTMRDNVFRFKPDEFEVLSSRQIEEELGAFREEAGRNWVAKWIEAIGVREIVKRCEPDTIAKVVEELTGDRKKAYRVAVKMRRGLVNSKMIRREASTQKTLRSLYRELERKVMAA